jgi:hypothetical protein
MVAFMDHPLRGADNGWITTIDRNGAKKQLLPEIFSSAQGLAWRPDGREIWFTASDMGFLSYLRAVTLDGRERVLLRSPSRLVLQDIASDGRVLLDSQAPQIGTHVLVPGEPIERDLSWLDCSFIPDMSPDAKMVVISEQGSPATRISDGFGWGMSRDGKWVITQSGTEGNHVTLVPTGAGTPRQLTSTVGDYFWPQFTPDGSKIYFGASTGDRRPRLYMQSVDNGKPVAISGEGFGGGLFPKPISPDGKRIATIGPDRKLMLVPVDGSAPQPLPGSVEDENAAGWSADGRTLYTFVVGEQPLRIYRHDVQSGTREVLREIKPPDSAGILFSTPSTVTADGRGYAYTYGRMISGLFVVNGIR